MGDYASRNSASAAPGSVGGSSPRWAAEHPRPAAQPTVTQGSANVAATGTQQGAVGAVPAANSTAAPWTNTTAATNNTATPAVTGPVVQPNLNTIARAMDPPGEACGGACRAQWQRCFDACNDGQDRGCVAQCDEPYRDCMRGCY